MNEAEKLLEKFARKNMIEWNQESFKRTHSRLHKSIIEALNQALHIHDVSGEVCNHPYEYLSFGEDCYCECEKCNTRLS